nr:uncharacterized protein LOC111994587 [Quercus suber]
MGKKRRLPLIDVGAGPARSQQRGEENLEAAHTTPHARVDAPDAGTTPPGLRRDFPLTIIEVGDGSSRSRDRVEEDLRAAFAADHALGDASDDDETQPPSQESLVQQTQETSNVRAENLGQATPGSSNGTKKRGNTLMRKIWALPPDEKIQLPLNASFQPLGESGQTFVRWLGTFCICHVYCPLMPLNWAHVPPECKANAWTEIQKKWEIHPEVLPPANQMSWAMHLLGELRRNRRTKLKQKLYTEGATKEEVLAKIPAWAEPQQFADLVDYWFDPKTETLVNNNKRSRSFQKDIARSGPISFAQIADNMAKDSGQAVERAVLFQKVYSKKDGTPVSTDVGAKISKMKEILNNGGSLQGERHQGILWSKTDAFAQVMGKERCGRVRGVGFGPTPSGRSGATQPCYTSTPPSSSATTQQMTDLENSLRDELAQAEQRHQEKIADLHAKHKEEIAELHARHKEEVTEAIAAAQRNILDQLQPFLNTLSLSQVLSML